MSATGDRFLDPWLIPTGDPARALLAALRDRIDGHAPYKPRRPDQWAAWTSMIDVVGANLALAVLDPPPSGRVVMAIRARRAPGRYRNRALGKTLPDLLRLLEAAGLAETVFGGNGSRIATTCRPTQEFAALVSLCDVSTRDFGRASARGDTIVLTRRAAGPQGGKRKLWIDYIDTPETTAMRREMEVINAHIAGADITFVGAAEVDTADRWMSRRFTILPDQSQRFDQCGRLFGAFWESLRKRDRAGLRINGEPCVVLDYASMFTRIAFAQAGVQAPTGDLYEVPALRDLDRQQRKAAFNTFMFTRPGLSRWPAALFDEGLGSCDLKPFPRHWTPRKVRAAVLDHHPCLAAAFNTTTPAESPLAGFHLMFLESRLMVALLLRLADDGLVGLPLHDALIVPASNAPTVQSLMEDLAHQVIGCPIPVSAS